MAFGTFTLVIGGEQQDGTVETRAKLHLVAQGSGVLRDDAGNEFKFPTKFAKAEGEGISLDPTYELTLFTDSTSGNSTTIGYEGYVRTDYGRVPFAFAAPQAGSTVQLVDLTDDVILPVSDLQVFRDETIAARDAALAVGSTNDTIIAGRVNDSTSATTTALTATYGRGISFTDPRIGGVGDGTTDNTPAWNAAMTLLEPTGGMLFFPRGVYKINGTTNAVPGGVLLMGTGFNYGAPAGSAPEGATPSRGAVIRAGAAMTRLIELGRNPTTSAQADTGASMQNLIVDGQNLADSVVKTAGRRNYIRDCQIYWGNLRAVHIAGQNSYITGGVQAQDNRGDVILVGAYFDHKIFDGQQRQPGTTGACIRINNAGDVLIRGNHMWAGANGVTTTAESLITVENNAAVVGIVDNILEGVLGPEILLNAAATTLQNINITGNQFFNNDNSPDATHPIIAATGTAGGFISDVAICGNIARGQGSGKRYKALVTYSGTLSGTSRWVVTGNSLFCCQFAVTGSGSAPAKPRWTNNSFYDGSANKYTEDFGEATFSGNGSTTDFTITTSLIGLPVSWQVTPSGTVSAAPYMVFISGNNLVVRFTTAPVTGTNNVKLAWHARTTG